jgi:hypothetical protein
MTEDPAIHTVSVYLADGCPALGQSGRGAFLFS